MTQEKIQLLEKLKYNPFNRTKILDNHTDKIILPERILNKLINIQKEEGLISLPHPLVFKLSTPSYNTYVGVKEFHDQDEDSIFVSNDVCNRLNIKLPIDVIDNDNDNIEIDYDYVEDTQMLSLELALNVSGFEKSTTNAIIELYPRENYRVQDWKIFLEATLSNKYTAVTTNDVLTFEVDKQEYILDVVGVKTSENIRTVCVVDRDIELIIKTLDNEKVSLNKDIGSFPGEYVDFYGIKEGEIKVNQRVKLEIKDFEKLICDGEFVLAFDSFVDDERFEYGSMNKAQKEWNNSFGESKIIYVYALGKEVTGSIEGIKFSIGSNCEDSKNIDDVIDEDSIKCIYCNNIIKKSSQFLHENFCRRNNILCPNGCGEVFLKNIPKTHWHCCSTFGNDEFSLKLHNKYNHENDGENDGEEITCDYCNKFHCSNKYILSKHKCEDCSFALHECQFCHLILPKEESNETTDFYGISSHEWLCGSKTTECMKCNKIIKLRELEIHMEMHNMNRLSRNIPKKCSNLNCVNTIKFEDHNNNVGLCKDCFGSLYSNVFDPDGKKLMQRIERKYILQIKNGCGDIENCCNLKCCSCSKCEIPIEIRASMGSVVKYVKNEIIKNIDNKNFEFEFCVSKKMNERRKYVNMFENGDWALGWICKSNEINGNDLDKMNEWLKNNAVSNEEYDNKNKNS